MKQFLLPYALALCAFSAGNVSAADEPAQADERQVRTFLKRYCVRCHGEQEQSGELRLDTLQAEFTDRDAALSWLEVRNRINLGEMPPDGEQPRPSGEEVAAVSRWIAAEVRRVERQALRTGGRVVMRRLNRDEYTHTVADLLHMKFGPGESPRDFLPPDGTAEGFDKVSSALLLDPSLMSSYYRVARRIADKAIVDGPPEFPTETMRLEFEEIAKSRAIDYLVLRLGMKPVPGGLQLVQGSTRSFGLLNYPGEKGNNVAPVKGFYRFTLRVGGAPGADGERPRVRVIHKHPQESMQPVMEFDVDAPYDEPREYSVVIPRDELGGEISVSLVNETDLYTSQRPGEHFRRRIREVGERNEFAEVIRLRGRWAAEGAHASRSLPDPEKLDVSQYPRVFLDWLDVEGPLYEAWPPKSHTMLLFRGEDAEQDVDYAREIFTRFLPRAWRRPVKSEEVDPIVDVVATELEHGQSFHEAIRVGLVAALTSPKFLYLNEPAADDGEPRPLSDWEIASRLSYFLWSSLPDDALRELAAAGKLNDPDVLTAQVDRMLADPKVERFVQGFAAQWLRTDTFLAFAPDQSLYRDYDDDLGRAAVEEPLAFFRTVLQENLSVLNFVDSDFAVVDERLAQHYGIAGVEGEEFRKVPLPEDSPRGGLLGMMGVHMAGSDGIRTKPVSRGVYVREVLFNDPPDPPPPNAGEIEPNIKGENLTVRERLIQHQQIASCAACHRNIDPYGLALENFNVIGSWREKQDGEDFRGSNRPEIDASGTLPNGVAFAGFAEYRRGLAEQDDRFRRALAERLLTYAMGRPVEPTDDATLDAAVAEMKRNGDTLRSLITALVTSRPFLEK